MPEFEVNFFIWVCSGTIMFNWDSESVLIEDSNSGKFPIISSLNFLRIELRNGE